jgi:hypothetical protein
MESDHPLFRYFTEAERDRIEAVGEVKRIAQGAYLIRAGEIDSTLFAIEECGETPASPQQRPPVIEAERRRPAGWPAGVSPARSRVERGSCESRPPCPWHAPPPAAGRRTASRRDAGAPAPRGSTVTGR